jgi:hypothetical protein
VPVDGRQRVERGDDRALHVDASASVQPAVLDGAGREPPRDGAGRHDVDVAADREAPVAAGRRGDGEAPQLLARRLLAGVARVRAERGEVVLMQIGAQPQPLGELGEKPQRGALVPGDAGHPDERGRIAGKGPRVDHGVASSAVGSDASSAAWAWIRRTALVSARA